MQVQQAQQLPLTPVALEPARTSQNTAAMDVRTGQPSLHQPQICIAPVMFIPLWREEPESIFPTLNNLAYKFVKPALDALLILLSAPFWLPLCLFIALVVWIEDGASPLFFQNRIGRNGRRFTIWKFRTMTPDADDVLRNKLLACAESRREWNEYHKLKYDLRITAAGKILRRFSLDELPQLVNVLLGHMSLIGPRPLPEYHHGNLSLAARTWREKVKPGLTGLWQVSGRSDIGNRGMELWDPFYVRNWSMRLDFSILMRTFKVVSRGKGAY